MGSIGYSKFIKLLRQLAVSTINANIQIFLKHRVATKAKYMRKYILKAFFSQEETICLAHYESLKVKYTSAPYALDFELFMETNVYMLQYYSAELLVKVKV